MKTQDLFEQRGNTSIQGVLATIASIYNGTRVGSNPKLCHVHTASSIDANRPDDMIVLYGFGDTVAHSAVVRDGNLVDQYAGVTSSKLMRSGNLQINMNGNIDVLEPVYQISVGDFLESW